MQSLASDPKGHDTEPQQGLLACLKLSPGLKLAVREEGPVPTVAPSREYTALWLPTPALHRVRTAREVPALHRGKARHPSPPQR